MIYLTAYFSDTDEDFVENELEFNINSSGYYKLKTITDFVTSRPEGRHDYQLIYVAGGSASFIIDGKDICVSSGSAVIYKPETPQYYSYYLKDAPEIYWMHFSGKNMDEYLKQLGFFGEIYYQVSYHREYSLLFERIIKELQFKKTNFREIASAAARQLLLVMSRNMYNKNDGIYNDKQIEKTIQKMYKHYADSKNIEDYARDLNMSRCWFLKCFKKQTSMSPQKFLTEIRIQKAKELLYTCEYNITEVSRMVGYEDPLYFSRIFKRITGTSPREFKEKK